METTLFVTLSIGSLAALLIIIAPTIIKNTAESIGWNIWRAWINKCRKEQEQPE